MVEFVIVTNNPLVREGYEDRIEIDFIDAYGYFEVLDRIRRLVHKGWVLETHPLSGSVKPNETPYKTAIVSKRPEHSPLDFNSLQISESAIETYQKLASVKQLPRWGERTLADFRMVDKSLIDSAVSQMRI